MKRVRNERESSIYIPSENVREELRNGADDPLYLPLQGNAERDNGKRIHYFRNLNVKYS